MKIVIVGAGPVGCATSLLLAQEGHEVKLYEKYGGARNCRSRSINITLSNKGIRVLKRIISDVQNTLLQDGVKAFGRIVHDRNGKQYGPTFYSQEKKEAIISFKRSQLNDFLLAEAENNKNIEIFHHHEFISCDPATGSVTFHNTLTDALVLVDGDVIIGADGAHSCVRQCMQKSCGLRFIEQKRHDLCYIEFSVPKHSQLAPDMLHIWPRGEFMMLALPNKDESFCGNLYMCKEDFQRIMTNNETLLEFCRKEFRDLLDIIGENNLVIDMEPKPNYSPFYLTSVKCEPYHMGKVVIIGDAAHTVVPFYGQGLNAGFQDCEVLMRIFDKYKHDKACVPKILEEFSEEQCKNGQAIADLAFEHSVQLRSGIAGKKYYIRHHLDSVLNTFFPEFWPVEYNMVAFSDKSYHSCLQVKRQQESFLMIVFCCVSIIFMWYFWSHKLF